MEITDFLQKHWVSVFVAVYLAGMTLYGHYRGFLRLSISMAALVLSALTVRFAMPQVTSFMKENLGVDQKIEKVVKKMTGLDAAEDTRSVLPSQQRTVIENMELPESIKKALIENNNTEIYQILGVDVFVEYIASYLADRILNTLVFVVLFLIMNIGLRLLARGFDLAARLPVLHGLNQIAGAILGLILALSYFWVFCLALNLFVGTEGGRFLLNEIESTPWVSFLYHHNLLSYIMAGIIWNLF